MHKNSLQRQLRMLLTCLPLLVNYAPKQQNLLSTWTPQSAPLVLPLPSEAKQSALTPQCSPTCSEALQKEARYHAGQSDESYRAGMICERIYDSIRY